MSIYSDSLNKQNPFALNFFQMQLIGWIHQKAWNKLDWFFFFFDSPTCDMDKSRKNQFFGTSIPLVGVVAHRVYCMHVSPYRTKEDSISLYIHIILVCLPCWWFWCQQRSVQVAPVWSDCQRKTGQYRGWHGGRQPHPDSWAGWLTVQGSWSYSGWTPPKHQPTTQCHGYTSLYHIQSFTHKS